MNDNFWSYRLHKLGTPKALQTDRVDPLLDRLVLSSSILTSWEFQVRGFHYSRDLSPRVLLLRVPATSKVTAVCLR